MTTLSERCSAQAGQRTNESRNGCFRSSDAEGLSSSKTLGSRASARARMTIWRSPPDSAVNAGVPVGETRRVDGFQGIHGFGAMAALSNGNGPGAGCGLNTTSIAGNGNSTVVLLRYHRRFRARAAVGPRTSAAFLAITRFRILVAVIRRAGG